MNKVFYKVQLSFKGTKYLGWQKQKEFTPTVQDELNKALVRIFKEENITTVACGRTDSGVHASNMTVKLEVPFFIDCHGLQSALNSQLDRTIRINLVEECSESFLPTYNAKAREYFYLFTDKKLQTPFESDLIASIKADINIQKIDAALSLFVGEHDFKNYMCVGSEPSSTIREIFSARVEKIDSSFHGMIQDHFKITISGNGFLKQMVRLIVGTAIAHSNSKISLEDIKNSLTNPSVQKLAPVAPANGLYKSKVSY